MEPRDVNVTHQLHVYLLDVAMNLVPAYILPFGLILSLINNLVAIGILLGNERIINILPATIRINFIANAINDLNCLGPTHLTIILGDGLQYASGGKYTVRWDLFSNQTCKLRFCWYFQSDSLTQYLLLALAIERVISLYRPLAVRVWASNRNGCRLLAFLTISSVVLAAPSLNDFEIDKYSLSGNGLSCVMVHRDWKQRIRFYLVNAFLCVHFPRIAVFVCTIILQRKIRAASIFHNRLKMPPFTGRIRAIPNSIWNGAIPRRELRLARPVLLFAILELFVTLQLGVMWALYFIFKALHSPPEWLEFAGAGGRLALYATIMSHFWNLYIYCATIPVFRQELLRIIRCRLNRGTGLSRSIPATTPNNSSHRSRSFANRDPQLGGGVTQRCRSGTSASERAVSISQNTHNHLKKHNSVFSNTTTVIKQDTFLQQISHPPLTESTSR